jgi:hypothetical protein
MDPLLLLVLGCVLLAWLLAVISIRGYGPGTHRRRVRCPEKNASAVLTVVYTEPDFGSVRALDVAQCSLLGARPVTCDKKCLAQL